MNLYLLDKRLSCLSYDYNRGGGRLKALVEGPKWVGLWTEIVSDVICDLGFDVTIYYHNQKKGAVRFASKVNRMFPFSKAFIDWEEMKKRELFQVSRQLECDLLFSIQGKLDSELIKSLKSNNPEMKIVYWLGDVFVESAKKRLLSLKESCLSGQLDLLLVSYMGTYDYLVASGFKNVIYFPFGVTRKFHDQFVVSDVDRKKFSAQVSFVGTSYPERVELITYLNKHLENPIQVWGRSWLGTGVKSNGPVSMSDSLKIYACSKISLNIHHCITDRGFNMKFYEIPASGGFQLCDWQPILEDSKLGLNTSSYRSKEMLLEKIQYFLANDIERESIILENRERVFEEFEYVKRLKSLFGELFNSR